MVFGLHSHGTVTIVKLAQISTKTENKTHKTLIPQGLYFNITPQSELTPLVVGFFIFYKKGLILKKVLD